VPSIYIASLLLAVPMLLVAPRAQAASGLEEANANGSGLRSAQSNSAAPEAEWILIAQKGNDSDSGAPVRNRKVMDAPVQKRRPSDSRRGSDSRAESDAPADASVNDANRDEKPKVWPGLEKVVLKKPKITGAFVTPDFNPAPGATVYLNGTDFGDKPGKIRMYGTFPGSPLVLESVVWNSPTKVNGVIPMSTSGKVCVKQVLFEVETANHLKSNWHEHFWKEDTVKLEKGNSVTKVLFCGKDGNKNVCNGSSHDGDACVLLPPLAVYGPQASLWGYHYNCSGALGNDEGTDRFEVDLKNGWYLLHSTVQKDKSSNSEVLNGPTPGFPSGESNWKPTFGWEATAGDYVQYFVSMTIRGPRGCSYKP